MFILDFNGTEQQPHLSTELWLTKLNGTETSTRNRNPTELKKTEKK
jgi:hypothetical protein